MMVLGVPTAVKTFFAKPVRSCSKPIRGTVAAMVLAFLLRWTPRTGPPAKRGFGR